MSINRLYHIGDGPSLSGRGPERHGGDLDTSLATTRSGLQETRQALKSLRASPLEDKGLALALRQLEKEKAANKDGTLTSQPSCPSQTTQMIADMSSSASSV
jgi:signal transduction histidine kinase